MKNTTISKQPVAKQPIGRQRSYSELVEYFDANWATNTSDTKLSCVTQLDKALNNVSQSVNTIIVTGTNGKSLTSHFTSRLLIKEGLKVGAFFAPHILSYNERFIINNESISNKNFTDIANEVITTAESLGLTPNTFEMLTIMALLYFKNNNVDVAILETHLGGFADATNICNPKITAVTRVIDPNKELKIRVAEEYQLQEALASVKPGTIVISGDQSKLSLQKMQTIVVEKKGEWAMPIRKVAALPYPFEQLHGRNAALAERIAYLFINSVVTTNENNIFVTDSLLTKQKGQRGRPTLEAKRHAELNPKKTVEQFWKETASDLSAKFQLLDKEKPSILLDCASNIDAIDNLLLGIRLLHYQRPLKGLTLILGCNNSSINREELLKILRYFFKKTSGQVIVCPIEPLVGHKGDTILNVETLTNDLKSMKVKAIATKSFKQAFEIAKQTVDERHGLVVITGSTSIVTEYWKNKGIKKI